MKNKRIFTKKLLSIQLIIIVILSMFFSIILSEKEVKATTYSQSTSTGISAFPSSYQSALKELQELHPNWTFTAYNTGMSWSTFISGETSTHLRNTIISTADSSWKCSCGKTASGYACASEDIIEYYADPRNFLTESGIFQFLEMSYNSSVQTVDGVKSILSNTFMSGSVTVTTGTTTKVAGKISGSYILVTPESTISSVASAIGVSSYSVKDTSSKTVSSSSTVKTGYKFTNSSNNTTYSMIVIGDVDGDGEIKAKDYAKIKNYIMNGTSLTDTQKAAADVNGDGEIKATDYAKIKNYIMNGTAISVTKGTTSSKTMSYAEIIMDAAEESGISPYSIAIKIIQEVGSSGSNSVSGTYSGYEGYYNFFNYGAYDSGNAIENALIYAKEKGWNNQYTAIVEGAKLMSDSYVGTGQNTAYFYKFDVVDDSSNGVFWHQYMTNIQDPSSQASTLYNTYVNNNIIDASLNFIIPVFSDMPSVCSKPSSIDTSASTSYYVTGDGVRVRSGAGTSYSSVATVNKNDVVTVINLSYATADGYTWAKIKTSSGVTGYIANKYLKSCN